jgi:hypothetical protein
MTDTPQILAVIMLETIATVMQKLALREGGGVGRVGAVAIPSLIISAIRNLTAI